jgi:predicted RNA-binding protein associated with RNAse of E/G family
MLRGWYANVTYPALLDPTTDPPTLTWHDLYLDVVALPDGTTVVRDEDELADSGVATTAPDLHALILAARDELLARRHDHTFPFHESPGQG